MGAHGINNSEGNAAMSAAEVPPPPPPPPPAARPPLPTRAGASPTHARALVNANAQRPAVAVEKFHHCVSPLRNSCVRTPSTVPRRGRAAGGGDLRALPVGPGGVHGRAAVDLAHPTVLHHRAHARDRGGPLCPRTPRRPPHPPPFPSPRSPSLLELLTLRRPSRRA
jgi:hypothetical protein